MESHLVDIPADAIQSFDWPLRLIIALNTVVVVLLLILIIVLATTSVQAEFGFSCGDAALLDLRSLGPRSRRWMP